MTEKRIGPTDWILTYTRKRFWPLDAKPEHVDIRDIAHALSNLCRYAGHTRHFYSVAQHSVHVSEVLQARGFGVDVQLAGLLHDATEAYLVDLPSPVKKFLPEYVKAEERLWEVIKQHFGLGNFDDVIKAADLDVFATEARDLVREPSYWQGRADCKPLDFNIIAMNNSVAKEYFMERFEALT